MPKRGAVTSWMRRSRSPGRPVISACTGALKPSCAASLGTSCTRPSVMNSAPATRSGGTSASAAPSAENRRVPSVSPSAWPASTTRTSRPAMRPSRCVTAARTASVCFSRSPKTLARALVDHDDRDGGQRLAVFARQRRIGERERRAGERERAHPCAAAADDEQQHRDDRRDGDARPTEPHWAPAARR